MRSTRTRGRRAFTLVELLVVIAIIAVMIGLLLPAVQKIREAAARAQCQSNLKQLGLAFYAHHDSTGAFPHGGTNDPGAYAASSTDRAQWSWCYQILPYVEQENLYRSASVSQLDTTPVRLFYCPARRAAALYGGKNKVDYAGNAGTDAAGGRNGVVTRPPGQPRCKIASIIDGTAYTVMLAEKQLNPAMFGKSYDDNESCFRPGWNGDWESYRTGTLSPARDQRMPGVMTPLTRFGSAHPAGLQAVFADGSVRPVRYGISASVWQHACARDDGASCDPGDL